MRAVREAQMGLPLCAAKPFSPSRLNARPGKVVSNAAGAAARLHGKG